MIELLVVCAIVIVISAIILIDNNKFGGVVTLENLAYDVALTVRQTQVYGIAVERFGQTTCTIQGVNCFTTGYGMRFSTAAPTVYYLFADLEGTGIFDPNYTATHPGSASTYPNGEVAQTDNLQQGYYVSSLAVIPQIGGTSSTSVTEIDILYRRPEPEAFISASTNGSAPVSCVQNPLTACYFEAQITLKSPKGDTRTVLVDSTGQITVEQ